MPASLAALLAALLAAPAAGAVVRQTTSACPSTTLSVSTGEDAAGTPIFSEPMQMPDGECVPVGTGAVKIAKICGPGTFTVSRMSCDRHDYKAYTIEHPGTEFTEGDCKEYKTAGTVVDGYVGSGTFSCSATER